MTSAQSPGTAPKAVIHANSAPSRHDHSAAALPAYRGATRALTLRSSASLAATCGFGASSKMSSSVQQPPNYEAPRCMLLRRMTRAHKIRLHRMHAMLWDELREGLAALREWP